MELGVVDIVEEVFNFFRGFKNKKFMKYIWYNLIFKIKK